MKSQVALEYLMVIGLALIVVIPFFYYALTNSSDSVLVAQTQDVVDTLAKTSDYVYSLGTGSSTKIEITIPENIKRSALEGHLIILELHTSSGVTNVTASSRANLIGTIPIESATYSILVNMTGSNVEIKKV